MNEKQFGYRVKQTLNRGLELDTATLDRLKSARLKALEKHREIAPAFAYAVEKGASQTGNNGRSVLANVLLSLLMLLLGLYASNHWYQTQLQQEIIEIDTEVLTGELPMDAYLDKGFEAWLKRSSD